MATRSSESTPPKTGILGLDQIPCIKESKKSEVKIDAIALLTSPCGKDKVNPADGATRRLRISEDTTPKSKDCSPRGRSRNRGRKRKRFALESSSDEELDLPESAQQVERTLQETAARNNLTHDSVKKILKKVVTNDHVLALVALREEEESAAMPSSAADLKITRAKAKELTKQSPAGTAPWNLELTPIKHIPVKTHPEVTALIAQDLPDESDEEYQLTNDDVVSDDDPTLESCSDIESQPRTPATPVSLPPASPQPETHQADGLFKVPTLKPASKKRQDSEEEATIALRTRSKLCLSSTPIESIEQSFVPPDEVRPTPSEVDHLWSNFLNEVLDPERTCLRTEEDDEADPEYNVAADQDVYDEDEETLERSLVNISRKELDDLYNELMGMNGPVPEPIPVKLQPMETDEEQTEATGANYLDLDQHRLGENNMVEMPRVPIPVKEESSETGPEDEELPRAPSILSSVQDKREIIKIRVSRKNNKVTQEVEYDEEPLQTEKAVPPKILRSKQKVEKALPQKVNIVLSNNTENVIEPAQILILEQQFRQHIQLATSAYLQIYVHPKLWSYAPTYKNFLISLKELADEKAAAGKRSVVEVCNLRAAVDLITCWEETLSVDTPHNQEMIKFYEAEIDRCMRRTSQNVIYTGSFNPTYMEVVASSSVFVYPYLLPAVPFRCDSYHRTSYLYSEDCLIALGLQQFYQHVERNRVCYKLRKSKVCFTQVAGLVIKHMLPWARPRALMYHIQVMRRHKDRDHPIRKYFEKHVVDPPQHKLLAFNPSITLHEQPQYETPLQWLKFLSRDSKRAKEFVMRRAQLAGHEPDGVEVDIENKAPIKPPHKKALPFIRTKEGSEKLAGISLSITPLTEQNADTDKNNKKNQQKKLQLPPQPYKIMPKTQLNTLGIPYNGGILVPIMLVSQDGTVNSTQIPIISTKVAESETTPKECSAITSTIYHDEVETAAPLVPQSDLGKTTAVQSKHCKCCLLMKKLQRKWPLITNYFSSNRTNSERFNCCVDKTSSVVSKRLKYLVYSCKLGSWNNFKFKLNCDLTANEHHNAFPEAILPNHSETLVTIPKETLENFEDRLTTNHDGKASWLNSLGWSIAVGHCCFMITLD